MSKIKGGILAAINRFKNRGNPNYRFTWGPEQPWSDDGQSESRY